MKNFVILEGGLTTTPNIFAFAVAQDSATLAVTQDVEKGSNIKAVYVTFDTCGLGASGVLEVVDMYLMKDPGTNLTPPNPRTWGSSNEKKFIFKTWRFMAMRNQDGNMPFHWEGWVPIPKRYQRMGADDRLLFVSVISPGTGHQSVSMLYKWYK